MPTSNEERCEYAARGMDDVTAVREIVNNCQNLWQRFGRFAVLQPLNFLPLLVKYFPQCTFVPLVVKAASLQVLRELTHGVPGAVNFNAG